MALVDGRVDERDDEQGEEEGLLEQFSRLQPGSFFPTFCGGFGGV